MKTQITATRADEIVKALIPSIADIRRTAEGHRKSFQEARDAVGHTSKWDKIFNGGLSKHDRAVRAVKLARNASMRKNEATRWEASLTDDWLFFTGHIENSYDYDRLNRRKSKLEELIKQLRACAYIGDPIYLEADEALLISKFI